MQQALPWSLPGCATSSIEVFSTSCLVENMSKELVYILQQLINVVQLSSFYVPLAMAFALIQAITRKVFLSFGDVAMFSSFAAVYVCFASLVKGFDDLTAALFALTSAILCAAAFGNAAARFVFAPVFNRSAQAYMITAIGFSIAIQEVMRLQSQGRDIWIPPLLQDSKIVFWHGAQTLQLPAITTLAMIISFIAVIAVAMLIQFSRFGRNWQACSQEISLAKLCGVNTDAVLRQTFMLGAGLSAVSGWIIAASYGGTSFSSGLMLGFKAMFAAVIGGFGSVKGSAIGAVSLAALEVLWSGTFSTAYRDVGVFSVIIFVLLLRPEGLAGLGNMRESE
jgi:branched-chain amino acid transport system permease protein